MAEGKEGGGMGHEQVRGGGGKLLVTCILSCHLTMSSFWRDSQ